jgi:hypothetical protein
VPVVRQDLAVFLVGESVLVVGGLSVPQATGRLSLGDPDSEADSQVDALWSPQEDRLSAIEQHIDRPGLPPIGSRNGEYLPSHT